MPYIKFKHQQFSLGPADLTVGAFDGAAARLPGDDPKASAVLRLGADGSGVVCRGDAGAEIYVNGVLLGAEPGILLHGDRIGIGGHELRYGEDTQGGRTSFAPGMAGALDAVHHSNVAGAARGRLVSLVDGREYAVPATGLSIGREIGCDIVVAAAEVSRRHAHIGLAEGAYVLTDLSTNGVFVNEEHVERKKALLRGDVLKVGPEEFRFYADAVVPERPAAAAQGTLPRGPLATLEIANEGPRKGTRFELYSPLTNIGRGAHNDVCVDDESLSASHAKILWRDGGWWLVDQDSTNGTYVGGRRVQGEELLVGAPDVRFGGVKMHFRAGAALPEPGHAGTRVIASSLVDEARRASVPAAGDAMAVAAAARPARGCAAVVAFVTALIAMGVSAAAVLVSARG